MAKVFPFSALVGQEELKRALLLGVIQPRLGGVLIRGTTGVAKSTAVRALSGLLPPIDTVAGCPFQRSPGDSIPDWALPADAAIVSRPVPLVELPLGASEDRVLGSLDLEKALRGRRAFEPGLLAAANRGILYIDEVNLLPDHLVDILLDASASGVHRLEREGLSLAHPAQFLLVGTMNPQEGELRPQLLDRFGLAVDVADLSEAAKRAEAVRRRLAFEADPERFAAEWRGADAEIAEKIEKARRLLPQVRAEESLLRRVSERCLAAGVEGLRADLTVCMAACAWAAYQGRSVVEQADVEAVAELALAHRRQQPPEPPPPRKPAGSGEQGTAAAQPPNGTTEPEPAAAAPRAELTRDEIAGLFAARVQPAKHPIGQSVFAGRGRNRAGASRGPIAGQTQALAGAGIAWATTLCNAGLRQATGVPLAGRVPLAACPPVVGEQVLGQTNVSPLADKPPVAPIPRAETSLVLRADDLRFWKRREPGGCLLLFVVDTSGSMAAWRQMRQTKAGVMALLLQAYQRRDRVALLAFRGTDAELVLPPAQGLTKARQALEQLPTGGTTPLAHGLAAARQFIAVQKRRQARLPISTVIFTDGRTNVPLRSSDAWQDALMQARALSTCASQYLVVNTETGWPRFGQAGALAVALGAPCVGLENLLGRPLAFEQRQLAVRQQAVYRNEAS